VFRASLTRFIRACTTEIELSRIAADPNSKGRADRVVAKVVVSVSASASRRTAKSGSGAAQPCPVIYEIRGALYLRAFLLLLALATAFIPRDESRDHKVRACSEGLLHK
jgi:hypothetical protein